MKLSESCGFGALRESLVRYRLVLGVKDERVRQKRDLDLDKVIETIEASQATHSRATEISEEFSANEDINAVGQGSKSKRGKRSHRKPPTKDLRKIKECLFCGGAHALKRILCPASGQNCKKCGKLGHFAVKCRSKSEDAKLHTVEQEDVFYIHSISGKDQALVSLTLNGSASVTF